MDFETNKPLEPPSEFIIKVQDINDNAPEFLNGPYHATVPEMSILGMYVSNFSDLLRVTFQVAPGIGSGRLLNERHLFPTSLSCAFVNPLPWSKLHSSIALVP